MNGADVVRERESAENVGTGIGMVAAEITHQKHEHVGTLDQIAQISERIFNSPLAPENREIELECVDDLRHDIIDARLKTDAADERMLLP